jgi:cytochrome c biogenesis protein CcdA
MFGVTLLVASVALADSINPSTIVPAVWLASAPRARGLASFTAGVFVVYLAGGLVLVFGPGPSLMAALHHVRGPAEHALQAAGGLLAVGFAVALWRSRDRSGGGSHKRRAYTRASAFALGAGIMAVELPTAFVYFGAISAILAARLSAPAEISLLITYNALFAAPLVAFIALRRVAGSRADEWIASTEVKLRRVGQLTLAALAGTAGAALLTIGLAGLLSV